MDASVPRLLLSIALAALLPMASLNSHDGVAKENIPHSRQKRILWITNDGRLVLPPGTTLNVSPTLSMPFVRHPPKGFWASMSFGLPFNIDFNNIGLTDDENPFGTFPPIWDKSMGRGAVSMMADYVSQHLDRRRGKRSTGQNYTPQVEKAILDRLHGGERAILYGLAEDLFANFGLDGKECLLRAICEIQAHPLKNFGLFGEFMKLFVTPSKSPYAHLLDEYVAAQKAGQAGGECWPYYRLCPKSIFQSSNKYAKDAEDLHRRQEHEDVEGNQIDDIKSM